ncbi:F-box protein-like protein [Tanacetum coccineum]|uniref:F-box protein-like protein n=1 Tax=Tanacetum coccineum TaxID=301880 RepID=A0ABQ5E8U6_9ASTR
MEEGARSSLQIRAPELDDFPELIHRIQSLLPVKEGLRTCVLSKTCLQLWSTIPTLRFHQPLVFFSKEQKRNYIKWIDQTMQRYIRDNIPIESFDLELVLKYGELFDDFDFKQNVWSTIMKKWMQFVASKSSLKELNLTVDVNTFSSLLSDEIFSGENLKSISVRVYGYKFVSLNPLIKCVSLRVLDLYKVNLSEGVLDNLLSTCILLEKISLSFVPRLGKVKVKNLMWLRELRIATRDVGEQLDIKHAPSLRLLFYTCYHFQINGFTVDSLNNLRELGLCGEFVEDHAFLDMIKSKFPLLEILTLEIQYFSMETLSITSGSLKRLILRLLDKRPINIQVHAPHLLYLSYTSTTSMAKVLFQSMVPEQIDVEMNLDIISIHDYSLFLNMREALNIPSRFNIEINFSRIDNHPRPPMLDVNYLRRRVLFPATNVQQLSIKTNPDERLWEHSPIFDALFWICHPKYVKICRHVPFKEDNYFWKLVVNWMMEKKTRKWHWPELKNIEVKNPYDGEWETVTSSWISFLDGLPPVDWHYVKFKLKWCSL